MYDTGINGQTNVTNRFQFSIGMRDGRDLKLVMKGIHGNGLLVRLRLGRDTDIRRESMMTGINPVIMIANAPLEASSSRSSEAS